MGEILRENSIAPVLLCVLDGLATWVWPTGDKVRDQEQQFKRLMRCRQHWGPEGKGRWLDKGNAADPQNTEFSDPLVHGMAHDEPSPARPAGYLEPIVRKWSRIAERLHDIVAQRLALGLLTLNAVSLLIFLGVEALPGDLAEAILGQSATPETVEAFRRELRLDLLPHERYLNWPAI